MKYENSVWVEIEQSDFPVNSALKNLYVSYWGNSEESDAKGLITWSKKAINDGFNSEKPETVGTWHQNPNRMCSD